MDPGNRYWNEAAAAFQLSSNEWLWRRHSDEVNRRCFDGSLDGSQVDRLLKTDLFDEAFGGGLLEFSLARARRFVGVDLSEKVLRQARARHPAVTLAGCDVRRLPFGSKRFDIVLSNSTLDHFHRPESIHVSLAEIHRVLRPSGRLLMTLDNPVNPVVAVRQMLPFRLLSRVGVVPFFTGATLGPGRLRRALQRAGFDVRRMASILHCPRFPSVVLCRAAAGHACRSQQRKLLRLLMAFERLSALPTRYITGYFIFACAVRT